MNCSQMTNMHSDIENSAFILIVITKGCSPEKNTCSFGFCPNEGGEGRGLPKFFGTFLINKRVYFFQNVNNLNCKLILRLQIYSILYRIYIIFSPKLDFKS